MPEVKPFRGYCYNRDRVNLDDVVAPPYDVISSVQRHELYARSEWNSVRLILGRGSDPYADAAGYWKKWRMENIIQRDHEPVIYLIAQRYPAEKGSYKERIGFIAACRMEEIGHGTIFRHERTLAKPREDRYHLIQATDALYSQIFAVYSDSTHRVERLTEQLLAQPPDYRCTFDGVENRLWRIADQKIHLDIATLMKEQKVLIADGHHRYETALSYSIHCRIQNPAHTGKEPYNFVPIYFTNLYSDGLTIFPTHRIIRDVPHFSPKEFLGKISETFSVNRMESTDEFGGLFNQTSRMVRLGMILKSDPGCYLLHLRDRPASGADGIPAALAELDVMIFQMSVLKNILHMTEEDIQNKKYLEYTPETINAIRAVREGNADAAFFLHPPRIEKVKAVAEAGLVMPQKSTYFYPKLLSGLVMYSFVQE